MESKADKTIRKARKKAFDQCFYNIKKGIESDTSQIIEKLWPKFISDTVRKSNDANMVLDELSNRLASGDSERTFNALVEALESCTRLRYLADELTKDYKEALNQTAYESEAQQESQPQGTTSDRVPTIAMSREPRIVSTEEHVRLKEEKMEVDVKLKMQVQVAKESEKECTLLKDTVRFNTEQELRQNTIQYN